MVPIGPIFEYLWSNLEYPWTPVKGLFWDSPQWIDLPSFPFGAPWKLQQNHVKNISYQTNEFDININWLLYQEKFKSTLKINTFCVPIKAMFNKSTISFSILIKYKYIYYCSSKLNFLFLLEEEWENSLQIDWFCN